MRRLYLLSFFCIIVITGVVTGNDTQKQGTVTGGADESIQVPPPPFSEDIFPCSDCHADIETNSTRRELKEEHSNIVLKHDEKNRWCFDCHYDKDRDRLHLANGTLIEFTESYRLCGQCHGTIYRDWRAGIHGKRTGLWNGQKQYLLCAHCHNPHQPKFNKVEPLPPPIRPIDIH